MKGMEDDFPLRVLRVHSVITCMRLSGSLGAQELCWVQEDPTSNGGEVPVAWETVFQM